jgi:hypothetical protein
MTNQHLKLSFSKKSRSVVLLAAAAALLLSGCIGPDRVKGDEFREECLKSGGFLNFSAENGFFWIHEKFECVGKNVSVPAHQPQPNAPLTTKET